MWLNSRNPTDEQRSQDINVRWTRGNSGCRCECECERLFLSICVCICVYINWRLSHTVTFLTEKQEHPPWPCVQEQKKKRKWKKKTPLQIISEVLSRSNQNLDSTSKSCKAEPGFALAHNNVLLVSPCLLIGYRPLSLSNPPDKKITNLDKKYIEHLDYLWFPIIVRDQENLALWPFESSYHKVFADCIWEGRIWLKKVFS